MQQVTFLHSKNGTSVICDDAQANVFASCYNIHKTAFGAADESAGASPQPCGY